MGGRSLGLIVVVGWYILSFYSLTLFVETELYINALGELPLALWYAEPLLQTTYLTIAIFVGSIVFRNASMYDAYWSVVPLIFVLDQLFNETVHVREYLLIGVVSLWGIRLTLNWIYTWPGLLHQDWRYTMLAQKSKWLYPVVNFTGIHLFPTLIVYVAFIPGLHVFHDVEPENVVPLDIIAAALGLLAVTLQLTADAQMHRFRKHNKGKVLNTGLWKWSRHPNYLGEVLMWTSVFLFGLANGATIWPFILCPLAMLLMFVFISIPMMEKRQSSKPGWSEYVKQAGLLLPKKF